MPQMNVSSSELRQRLQKLLENYLLRSWPTPDAKASARTTITILESLVDEDATHRGGMDLVVAAARAYVETLQAERGERDEPDRSDS